MAEQKREKPASAKQPPWEDLPPLCWEAVLRHLVSVADLESVSSVCKQFLYISNTVHTCLSITNRLTPRLGSLFWRFASLKSIDLSSFLGDPSSVLLQIAQFPLLLDHLDPLDLTNQKSPPLRWVARDGVKIGALRVLVLSNVGFSGVDDLVSIAECFSRLEELDISYPGGVVRLGSRMTVSQPVADAAKAAVN